MKCPHCGSDKVTHLYGIEGLMDRCTTCGSYFHKEGTVKKTFDSIWKICDEARCPTSGPFCNDCAHNLDGFCEVKKIYRFSQSKPVDSECFMPKRKGARDMHHDALVIAGMTFKLHIIEDQINRAKHAIAYRELYGIEVDDDNEN